MPGVAKGSGMQRLARWIFSLIVLTLGLQIGVQAGQSNRGLGVDVSAAIRAQSGPTPKIINTSPVDGSTITIPLPGLIRIVFDIDMDTLQNDVSRVLLPAGLTATQLIWRDARTLDIVAAGAMTTFGAKRVDLADRYFMSVGKVYLPNMSGFAFSYAAGNQNPTPDPNGPRIISTLPIDGSTTSSSQPTLQVVFDRDMDVTRRDATRVSLPDGMSVIALGWLDARTLDIQYSGSMDSYGAKVVDLFDSYFSAANGVMSAPAQSYGFEYGDPNSPPFMTAPPTADPLLLVPNTETTFTAVAFDPNADPLTYTWDFGDGKSGTGASVQHTFTTGGPFLVTVTVSDGRGGLATSSIVMADDGGAAAGVPWIITKGNIALNFSKAGKDKIQISGIIELTKDAVISGKNMIVNVGGAGGVFKLDAKGKAKVGKNSFKLTRKLVKKQFLGGPVKVQFTLAGAFANDLKDEGLTSVPTGKSGVQKLVRVLLGIDGKIFTAVPNVLWKNNPKGTSGKATFKSAVR